MNPYGNLYTGRTDVAIVLLLSLVIVTAAGSVTKLANKPNRLEYYIYGAAGGLLILNMAAFAVEIAGLIGFLLHLESALGYFWELAFILTVIGVFLVFPFIGVVLLAWWGSVRRRLPSSPGASTVIMKYFIANICCVGLYFLDGWVAMWRNG
jgi:hypothetical protein